MASEKFLSLYYEELSTHSADAVEDTFTVGELIDFLKQYPADMKVVTKHSFMYGRIFAGKFSEKILDNKLSLY